MIYTCKYLVNIIEILEKERKRKHLGDFFDLCNIAAIQVFFPSKISGLTKNHFFQLWD